MSDPAKTRRGAALKGLTANHHPQSSGIVRSANRQEGNTRDQGQGHVGSPWQLCPNMGGGETTQATGGRRTPICFIIP